MLEVEGPNPVVEVVYTQTVMGRGNRPDGLVAQLIDGGSRRVQSTDRKRDWQGSDSKDLSGDD
jgi:hypothetical protein